FLCRHPPPRPLSALSLTTLFRSHEAGARLVLLMTPAGQVLAQSGFARAVDVMSAAALGSAIMASTTELARQLGQPPFAALNHQGDRKSTRLNSSHVSISYAVFCL